MSTDTWSVQPKWKERPERLAWVVLLSSFAIFLILLVAIPSASFYAVERFSVRRQALLESTQGVLWLKPFRGSDQIAVTGQRADIGVGSVIEAASETTQGTLSFVSSDEFPQTLGSIHFYAGTTIEVEQISEPFFARSDQPYQVTLRLLQGQARIFNNSQLDQRALHVDLLVPHGSVIMSQEGTYEISATPEQTEVIVRSGVADVRHKQGEQELIGTALRAQMIDEKLLQKSAQQNLITNGNFTLGDDSGSVDAWTTHVVAPNVNPGSVQFIPQAGRKVASFKRAVGVDAHTEVAITQMIEKEVNLDKSLELQFDLRLLNQSLAGGGMLGSEFPLRVELQYTDVYGKVLLWGRGFYYSDLLDDDDETNDNWLLDTAANDKIPLGQWYTYRSPNLIEFLTAQGTQPAQINEIRFYASGHKYWSFLSEVYLFAQ